MDASRAAAALERVAARRRATCGSRTALRIEKREPRVPVRDVDAERHAELARERLDAAGALSVQHLELGLDACTAKRLERAPRDRLDVRRDRHESRARRRKRLDD